MSWSSLSTSARALANYRVLFWVAAAVAAAEAGLLLGTRSAGTNTTVWHYQHRAFRVNHATGLQEVATDNGWAPSPYTR